MFSRLATLFFASLLLISAPAFSAPIAIDFEHFPGPDGKLGTSDDIQPYGGIRRLSDEFASMGLDIIEGSIIEADFFDGNAANHFLSSTKTIIAFDMSVFGISITSKSYWDATLTAYGASGNILAIDILEHLNPRAFTMTGLLSVTSSEAIASFSIVSDHENHILNMDNMVLDVVEVPEPSQLLIFALGLVMLVSRYARRPG